jgi:hypothetical protein
MTELHEVVANETKAALIGKTVARANLGHGSILIINLAAQDGSEAYIRVECAWSLQDDTLVLAASEDARETLQKHVAELCGRAVRDVEVRIPSLQLRVVLDGGELNVFPVFANTDDYENWTIHTPNRKALVAGPGRSARVLGIDEVG